MVYYFTSRDGHMIYVGKDKFENEDLIKYGFPEDIWFHADDHSSAHVYLRLNEDESYDNIPIIALEDCCQLTKAGSIEGSKLEKINIVYTPWSNLHKKASMEIGAIGYHDEKLRKLVKEVEKDNNILNVLKKTKREEYPNLQELKEKKIQQDQKKKLQQAKEQKQQKIKQQQDKKEQDDLKCYKDIFEQGQFQSNKDQTDEDDDFM